MKPLHPPPPAARPAPAAASDAPRRKLLGLAAELVRGPDNRLLAEYLALRRTLRPRR